MRVHHTCEVYGLLASHLVHGREGCKWLCSRVYDAPSTRETMCREEDTSYVFFENASRAVGVWNNDSHCNEGPVHVSYQLPNHQVVVHARGIRTYQTLGLIAIP